MMQYFSRISLFKLICTSACMLSLASLSACGFALKGDSKPFPFSQVQLQASANSLLIADVLSRLTAKQVTLNTRPDAAVPRIALTNETKDKTVLSTTTTGRVREFQLKQSVVIQVFGPAGQAWLEPVTLVQSRDFAYNDSQILAKELEEQALYKDMQLELVLAIMRRLEATRTTPVPPAPVVPK
jgi:LPS-assembly lipoprotein